MANFQNEANRKASVSKCRTHEKPSLANCAFCSFSLHLTFPSHSLVPLSVPQTSGLYSQALTEVSIHSQSVQALTGQS